MQPLVITEWSATTITLARPAISPAGNPLPTVQAYIGLDGEISNVSCNISSYLDGPFDVSTQGRTFTGLAANLTYRIWVQAENTAGCAGQTIIQRTGYYVDHQDGTIYDPYTDLTWAACSCGQDYVAGPPGNCLGSVTPLTYCSEPTNACNGGTNKGLLGPPFPSGVHSQAWNCCDAYSAGGRYDWRVPTVAELATLAVSQASPPNIDHAAFPNTPDDDYWSANSDTYVNAFTVPVGGAQPYSWGKQNNSYPVRCVASGW